MAQQSRGREYDWDAARARLEKARRTLADEATVSEEAARAILEERARALARPIDAADAAARFTGVEFGLADERYAIESHRVIEVLRLANVTPLPGAPAPISGVTAWRGSLLIVLELRQALGLPGGPTTPGETARLVVIGDNDGAIGIPVDAVHDLLDLELSEVREPPAGLTVNREYVKGITPGAVLVLDPGKLLRLIG